MIYIVRHGQTELNTGRRLQGRSDSTLNDKGRAQAEDAASVFKEMGISFDHVFSSPLKRAADTARIISGTEPEIDERLIEIEYGPYEGVSMHDLPEEMKLFFSDFVNNPAPQGMEQLEEVVSRAGRFIEDIRGLSGDILISTHAIAMKGILEYLTPGSAGAYWNRHIGNCEVYAAENDGMLIGIPASME